MIHREMSSMTIAILRLQRPNKNNKAYHEHLGHPLESLQVSREQELPEVKSQLHKTQIQVVNFTQTIPTTNMNPKQVILNTTLIQNLELRTLLQDHREMISFLL